MTVLGVATNLDSFLKAYKTSETKGFFPYEWFDHPDKIQNPELTPYDAFYSKLRSCNPLETEHTDYVNLLKSGLSTEQAVIKVKLSKPPPTGIENYHYLQQIWKQEQMSSFKDFLRELNNKDFVPTLEAIQSMIAFYHDKDIDMLKLSCTLPNLATFANTNLLIENSIHQRKEINTFWKKFDKVLFVVHLSFLHAKQLLMKLLSESLQTYANLLLGLMPAKYTSIQCVNPCPPVFIHIGISNQKPVDSHLDRTRPVSLKIWSCLIFNVQDLIVKLRASTLQADRRKLVVSVLMGFVLCNTAFEAICCLYHFSPCRDLRPSLTEEDIKCGIGKKELDESRQGYVQQKSFTLIEMWQCECWRLYKTTTKVSLHMREKFSYSHSLKEQKLLERIKKRYLLATFKAKI